MLDLKLTFTALSMVNTVFAGESKPTLSLYENPIIPGFHPDPSCVFVPEWDDTYFCAHSTINVFPGIPITASKDLRNWRLIGKAVLGKVIAQD